MANPEHLAILKQGVEAWNAWRAKPGSPVPDLSNADLRGADLRGADLNDGNLPDADLLGADLAGANLSGAFLMSATLVGAKLGQATLKGTNFSWANLAFAELCGANLTGAILYGAVLLGADLTDAVLVGSWVHGVSAWKVKVSKATRQQDLIVSADRKPEITVDNIEVAQLVHLFLENEKIRAVIDTVTSKVVLILGRFTPKRKAILDTIREELRNRHYVPILFDFDVPDSRDITETVSLLARMSRFIIADLTEPSSIPKELEALVPHLAVPIQPLFEGDRPYAMFKDYWKYDWVLPVHRYDGLNSLLATLGDNVFAPAEAKTNDLAEKRRRFEAELVRPR